MKVKYGVRYPVSGIHECPFGYDQAQLIQLLAIRNGIVSADIVRSVDGRPWEVVG